MVLSPIERIDSHQAVVIGPTRALQLVYMPAAPSTDDLSKLIYVPRRPLVK